MIRQHHPVTTISMFSLIQQEYITQLENLYLCYNIFGLPSVVPRNALYVDLRGYLHVSVEIMRGAGIIGISPHNGSLYMVKRTQCDNSIILQGIEIKLNNIL
jgi:hypothetical protein